MFSWDRISAAFIATSTTIALLLSCALGAAAPGHAQGLLQGSSQHSKQQDGPTYQASRDDMSICYATTRLSDNSSGQATYGGLRNLDYGQGSIEYGTATLARPAGYQTISGVPGWAEVREQMTAADNYFNAAQIKRLNKESQATFFNRLKNFHGQILIYVHGYDELFDSAIKEMAELANEFQARSPSTPLLAIAFSWPSPGSTTAYSADEASLEWSEKPFREFINQVIQNKAVDSPVDLLAHSMGSRYAFNYALSQEANGTTQAPAFRNIFLSCSDVDYHTAEARRESVQNCASKMVYVFVNDNDGPLLTSQLLHQAARLGRPIDPGNNSSMSSGLAAQPSGLPGGKTGFLGDPSLLLNQAENMLSDKAVAIFGQKARSLVDQFTTGGRPVFTKGGQVSGEQTQDVTNWLAKDAYLSRNWGTRSRLIDDTGFVTINMGHRLAWPLIAGLMLDPPQDAPFTFAPLHKRPDAAMLKIMGGTPTYLYRYDRLDLSRLSR
ncbi:MAG: alpha/beta hydrolase [Cyanobacteria bacterium SZAS TMP-1]|nr:alpha/beta hydrolase [Cyanobacteria bacterium SZAS TMP-1]